MDFFWQPRGMRVTLYEQNPVIAVLLKDALRRAKKHIRIERDRCPHETDRRQQRGINARTPGSCRRHIPGSHVPRKTKSSLINKKLQLIQKLEPPCSQETDLFDAAISADPDKIIVKRPLKSDFLAGRKPSYTLSGKAIRYDCYTL